MGDKQMAVIAKTPKHNSKTVFRFTSSFFTGFAGFELLLLCVFNLFFFATPG